MEFDTYHNYVIYSREYERERTEIEDYIYIYEMIITDEITVEECYTSLYYEEVKLDDYNYGSFNVAAYGNHVLTLSDNFNLLQGFVLNGMKQRRVNSTHVEDCPEG